ncbi:MAG: sulfatase-like hydrolase/transferase [Phycisphaerales bacterium]|nr:sulfatase-like hydrolase/transferase [Phycisphaerales bacterium]
MPKPTCPTNVIVFFTDQQRHDSLGLHGNPLDLTPNLDRLATEGTHLFNTFTNQPVCGPARACLQTGLYATANGAYRNGVLPDPSHKMLAHYFKEAGYQTGYIGKWHLADRGDGVGYVHPDQRGGYDYWLASNVLEFTSDAYRTDVFDNDGNRVRLPGYRVDAITDAAIRYIDRQQSNPFFLFVSLIEPHFQNHRDDYPAPDVYRERYQGRWTPPDLQALGGTSARDLGGYWGMCRRLDEAFGRLCESVKSLDLWDNTAILFTSDHACHFKTRNGEYKRSCHENSIRIPGALVGGPFQNGGRLPQLTSLIDFPPTLLDAAGIPIPSTMQGRSLLPLVQRHDNNWPDDVFVQISESQVGRAIRTSRWKYGVTAPDKNGWKDMNSTHYVEEYLYDLYADPYELTNLVGYESHRQLSGILRKRLIARMIAAGEPEPTIVAAPPIKSFQRRVEDDELRK